MSRRYNGLDDELIEFVPQGVTQEDNPEDMDPVMVIGDPYDAAAVIGGGWDGIEGFLTRALDRLRVARRDVAGWQDAVTEHLDEADLGDGERERLLTEAMTHVGVIQEELVPPKVAIAS
ncbi:hypothetical protein [Micromonospora arborensis]|uniref:hypothetical protein n=1 Tax=Micromonospora arborensis TaxID=2116518 RepID=UPI0037217E02